MPKTKRSTEKEWMDLGQPFYTATEYNAALKQLGRIGHYLGGDRATLKAFSMLEQRPTSIVDVGCGGGAFTLKLAACYPTATVEGIDISAQAIAFAKHLQHMHFPQLGNVSFELMSEPHLPYSPKSIDVVTATLVCHHLTDEELVGFLQSCCKIAKRAVILNDLHRHQLAYSSFALIAPIFFPNRMIVHDGLLSIKRAFKRSEWQTYLQQAGLAKQQYQIKWSFPFRWLVIIDCQEGN